MNKASILFEEVPFETLHSIVKRYVGHAEEIKCTLLKGGLFNTTYKLTLPLLQRNLILRLGPVNRQHLLPFEHQLMKAEEMAYQLLSTRNIPCPEVLVCDNTKQYLDRDFMITACIPGISLADESISEESKKDIYMQVAGLTARMHSITGPAYGRIADLLQGRGHHKWQEFLLAHTAEVGDSCLKYGVFKPEEVQRILRIYEGNSELYRNIETPRMLHGDLWAGNVLVQRSPEEERYEVTAILDADRALFGDSDFEYASPWLPFSGEVIDESFLRDDVRILKMDTYRMLFAFIDTYIWNVQYRDRAQFESNKQRTLDMLRSIEIRL
ncbi:Phosphotransferase enzyme family protein [compost metagenome]